MSEKRSVLFVCSGNTCRSPMAEYLLRWMANQRGITDLEVDSAGVSPYGKLSDDARYQIHKRTGVEPDKRPSKDVANVDISSFTDILGMKQKQKSDVLGLYPDTAGIVKTLGESIGEPNTSVRDPYNQGPQVYQKCADELERMLTRWLDVNYPNTRNT